MSKQIVMLLTNAYRPDPRVQREARGLTDAGYQLAIICWDRRTELPPQEKDGRIHIIRVQDIPSGYGSGWRQLFYLPRFWYKAIKLARSLNPAVVHCHDFDTLYAGQQIKKQTGCALIYDAHEHYPALMSLYLPRPMVHALGQWEQRLRKQADATITASSILHDEFNDHPPVYTLGNYPEIDPFLNIRDEEAAALRRSWGVAPETLLVAYIGGFSRNRLLLPFIETAALLPEVQFHLWGDGLQHTEVETAVSHHPNAHYHGWLNYTDLPLHFRAADIIYYGLRQDYPGAQYNAPNTIPQAMAAARPVIAGNIGDLGRMVNETQCGILLSETTAETIAAAIRTLKNSTTREKLGENGRLAARQTYNAKATQQQLIRIYQALTGARHK
jgi:glycosyltransferase involved in cell wall biosynthesis